MTPHSRTPRTLRALLVSTALVSACAEGVVAGPKPDAGHAGFDAAMEDVTDPGLIDDVEVLPGEDVALTDPDAAGDDASLATVTVAFQDGVAPSSAYTGTRDAYLRQNVATTNYGAAAALAVDGDDPAGSNKDNVGLLQWAIAAIPAGSTVIAASITVHVTNAGARAFPLLEARRAWAERQTTWTLAATGTNWATAGALGASDRGTVVLGSLAATTTGAVTLTLNAAGVALVQSWVDDPTSNHGVIVASTTITDGIVFASREATPANTRPRLSVRYQPP